jgi:hypothetical protein
LGCSLLTFFPKNDAKTPSFYFLIFSRLNPLDIRRTHEPITLDE